MRKTALMLIVATLLVAAPALRPMRGESRAQSNSDNARKLPSNWDARIPLPVSAHLISSRTPQTGQVYSAEFLASRSYHELVDFYETELPKAGFKMGPKTAIATRRYYKRTFTDGHLQYEVIISPRPGDDRALLLIHVNYTPHAESNQTSSAASSGRLCSEKTIACIANAKV